MSAKKPPAPCTRRCPEFRRKCTRRAQHTDKHWHYYTDGAGQRFKHTWTSRTSPSTRETTGGKRP